ncbi:universal stress protein [Dyadobacter sp. NIV53]|uniref:universal stress protein n=1 Tax=Dyadobacter sp. NIV53 TaxID=2861765 RepID=UPI001C86FA6C|nr:universal stress protein [Dyadobacter sp. NIV53]
MKKIQVPCGFSEEARQAYKFAWDIAIANEGELVVLHVVDLALFFDSSTYAQPYYVDSGATPADLTEGTKKDFNELIQDYPQGVPLQLLVEQWELHQTIVKTIEELNSDLIVMGTKGAASLRELRIGSNTEKIVRNAPVPVFTVHQAMPVSKIKDIVFPAKLDLTQRRLIAKLKTLQTFFGATVRLHFIRSSDVTTIDNETTMATDNFAKFYQLDKLQNSCSSDP